MNKFFVTFFACLMATGSALSCASSVNVQEMAAAWASRQPMTGLDAVVSMEEAECIRSQFQQALQARAGKPVGYKVGLTNPNVQKVLGHGAPISGVLMETMLLANEAPVSARFGTRPLMEADLLVEVGDDGINDAKSPAEVMRHLSALMPFIELPDLLIDPKVPMNGVRLVAVNVGARLGVVGKKLAASPALTDDLAGMSVILSEADGKVLAQGKGSDILGHPLNAVIWLADDLARRGERLRKGDLISLGSFNAPLKPEAGQVVTVRYPGLPGMGAVTVRFE